jgi:predicted CXXCH cytochrome family protein
MAATGKALCSGCHTVASRLANLSPGHQMAAKIFHSNSDELRGLDASQACMICHSENRNVQIDGNASISAPRFSERHTHPLGEIAYDYVGRQGTRIRQKIDARLQIFNNRIECQTCHNLGSTTRYRLAGFETPQELCAGCHIVD